MLVYHTSDTQILNPDVQHSRNALDFGKGFYVTRIKDQAIKYSERFSKLGKTSHLHTYEYIPDQELKLKVFEAYDEVWLNFVCNCRQGGNDYKAFDIIEGGVANDKVFQTVDLYINGIYNLQQALQKLIYEKPNNQICFTSQVAIDKCLKFVEHRLI